MQVAGVIGLALILIGLGAVYVLYPLMAGRRSGKDYLPPASPAEPSGLRRELKLAREERERIYSSLAELDHDFKAGDLNQTDYYQLHSEYRHQAVEVLVDLDRLEARERQIEEEIEQAVAKILSQARLSKKTRAAGSEPGRVTAKNRADKFEALNRAGEVGGGSEEPPLQLGRFCQRCGHEAEMSDAFCSRCGLKLSRLED